MILCLINRNLDFNKMLLESLLFVAADLQHLLAFCKPSKVLLFVVTLIKKVSFSSPVLLCTCACLFCVGGRHL